MGDWIGRIWLKAIIALTSLAWFGVGRAQADVVYFHLTGTYTNPWQLGTDVFPLDAVLQWTYTPGNFAAGSGHLVSITQPFNWAYPQPYSQTIIDSNGIQITQTGNYDNLTYDLAINFNTQLSSPGTTSTLTGSYDFYPVYNHFINYEAIGTLTGTLAPMPVTLYPTGYAVTSGALVSGDLSTLQHADGQYLVVKPSVVQGHAPRYAGAVQVVVSTTAPTTNPSSLKLSLVAHSSKLGVLQSIELFDYSAGAFAGVDTRLATRIDQTVVIAATDPARFVNPSTREVEARFTYNPTGSLLSLNWMAFIDQATWEFVP